jgi:hypothetical protein
LARDPTPWEYPCQPRETARPPIFLQGKTNNAALRSGKQPLLTSHQKTGAGWFNPVGSSVARETQADENNRRIQSGFSGKFVFRNFILPAEINLVFPTIIEDLSEQVMNGGMAETLVRETDDRLRFE